MFSVLPPLVRHVLPLLIICRHQTRNRNLVNLNHHRQPSGGGTFSSSPFRDTRNAITLLKCCEAPRNMHRNHESSKGHLDSHTRQLHHDLQCHLRKPLSTPNMKGSPPNACALGRSVTSRRSSLCALLEIWSQRFTGLRPVPSCSVVFAWLFELRG